jgi:hypothetical protein
MIRADGIFGRRALAIGCVLGMPLNGFVRIEIADNDLTLSPV